MLESIWMKNFRKHQNLKVTFDGSYNLIYGRNNAGKSTIFYAIEYALFGAITGFKKIEQVTSFGATKTGVQLIFTARDGNKYKLQRMHELGKKKEAKGSFTLKKILPTMNEDGVHDEQYILASDLGNHEDELSLKINELTGISRRFFNTGMHFQQGSIIEMLNGEAKLDIVFGITAATTLEDTFGSLALGYEKEAKQKDMLNVQKAKLVEDKKREEKQLDEQLRASEGLKEAIAIIEAETKSTAILREDIILLKNGIMEHDRAVKASGEAKVTLDSLIAQQAADAVEFGTIPELEQKHDGLIARKQELATLLVQKRSSHDATSKRFRDQDRALVVARDLIDGLKGTLESLAASGIDTSRLNTSKLVELQLEATMQRRDGEKLSNEVLERACRDLERKLGDVSGMLQRRRQSQGKGTCEYCGAPISAQQIAADIDRLQHELDGISGQLTAANASVVEGKARYEKLFNACRLLEGLGKVVKKLEGTIAQFEIAGGDPSASMEGRVATLESTTRLLESQLADEKKSLDMLAAEAGAIDESIKTLASQLSRARATQKRIDDIEASSASHLDVISKLRDIVFQRLLSIKHAVATFTTSGQLRDPLLAVMQSALDTVVNGMSMDAMRDAATRLWEAILKNEAETTATLRFKKEQSQGAERLAAEIKNRVLETDRSIATLSVRLDQLDALEHLAEKYRKIEGIFAKYRETVRATITSALETEVLRIHGKLSVDDEYNRVEVDPATYVLSVAPKHASTNMTYPALTFQGGGHKLILGLAYKLAIGAIAGIPPFLLIDEPTEFMDIQNRQNLLANLKDTIGSSQLFLITHQDTDKITGARRIEIAKGSGVKSSP